MSKSNPSDSASIYPLPLLKPNQTRRFDIDVTILNDKNAIEKAADNIIELTH